MLKHVVVFLFLPFFLFSQEQVSNIESYGLYQPTDIRYNVGFAKIDDVQYMIEEKDSVVISKFVNGVFIKQHVIENDNCDLRIYNTINPNRSLFDIRGSFYYRFLIDGIQIIDIAEGTIEYDYDFMADGFTRVIPSEMTENRYYFYGLPENENQYQTYMLDMSIDEVKNIVTPANRQNIPQVADLIAGVESSKNIYIYNAYTNLDSLVFESLEGIHSLSYSKSDNSFVVMESDGSIWKVDKNLNLIATNCTIADVSNLESIEIKGSKAIVAYNYMSEDVRQDSIAIIDIENCEADMTFITDPIASYAVYSQHVIFEKNNNRFSIFGNYGFNETDGFNQGAYYIIDHVKNTYTQIPHISSIQPYTPIVVDSSVYFVGINSSYWGANEYIVQYSIPTNSITKLDPNPDFATEYVTLGYPENNGLINVFNTYDESPVVWNYDGAGNFDEVQPLDFRFNLGAGYIDNVIPLKGRLYFSTFSGIYSVYNDSRTEFIFDDISFPIASSRNNQIAVSGDKLAVASFADAIPKFTIINSLTGEVDSIIEDQVTTSNGQAAGPFIFYSQGSGDSELHFYDVKTESIQTFSGIPYIVDSWLVRGVNNAFYYHDSSFGNKVVYLIDYKTNEFIFVDIDIWYEDYVVKGYDDSYYIIDREIGSDNSRIRLLTKDGNVQTIYEGVGRFSGERSTYYKNHPATIINLRHNNETSIYVTNDLVNTTVFDLPHYYQGSVRDEVLNSHNGKILFKTHDEDGDGRHYWLYQAFETPIEIEFAQDQVLAFSDLTENRATLVFYDTNDGSTDIVNYDIQTHEKSIQEEIENTCGSHRSMDGIALGKDEYLITMYCDVGYEPLILNVEEGSLELLVDNFPGLISSFPRHFVRFKDWIYFTLRKKDNSVQWFRLDTNFPTSIEEVDIHNNKDLKVYPTPTREILYLESDLVEIHIYSIHGQLVHKIDNYKGNEPLVIDFLSTGKYTIVGWNINNEIMKGSFVKMN